MQSRKSRNLCPSNILYLVYKSGFGVSYLSVRTQRAQVAFQVSVGHELHHHQGWLAFRHDAQQTHLGDEHKGFLFP